MYAKHKHLNNPRESKLHSEQSSSCQKGSRGEGEKGIERGEEGGKERREGREGEGRMWPTLPQQAPA